MFRDLYQHLRQQGFEVNSIGQKPTECTKPFLVIYEPDEQETSFKALSRVPVEIWVFYPFNEYSKLESFLDSVENSMSKFKKLRKKSQRGSIQIDEEMKAYFTNISYYRYVYKK